MDPSVRPTIPSTYGGSAIIPSISTSSYPNQQGRTANDFAQVCFENTMRLMQYQMQFVSPALWPPPHIGPSNNSKFRLRTRLGPFSVNDKLYNTDISIYKTITFPSDGDDSRGSGGTGTEVDHLTDASLSSPNVCAKLSIGALTRLLVEKILPSEFLLRIANRSLQSAKKKQNCCEIYYGDGYVTHCYIKQDNGTNKKRRRMSFSKSAQSSKAPDSTIIPRICVQLYLEGETDDGMNFPCQPRDLAKSMLISKRMAESDDDVSIVLKTDPSCWIRGAYETKSDQKMQSVDNDIAEIHEKIREVTIWSSDEDPGVAVGILIKSTKTGELCKPNDGTDIEVDLHNLTSCTLQQVGASKAAARCVATHVAGNAI